MSDSRVTLKDVYEAVNRLEDKMGKRLEVVERDVDNLQAFQNKSLGILGVFSTFIGLISTYVWNLIIGQR